MRRIVSRLLPLTESLRGYQRDDLRRDLVAGITVAVMLIPQAMAYAMLAGLPPIVGLYAATGPLLVYALFGTSRQLAVGPVAMISLMVAAAVGELARPDSGEYLAYAVLLAAMVGAMQLGMGLLRLGFLVNFLSHPVVSGFTSAAALIIGFSQLKHLLGVDIPRSHHVHAIIGHAVAHLSDLHGVTLSIGIGAIVLLLALRRYAPRAPGALSAVLIGTLAVYLLGLHEHGVSIVREVPDGLPAPSLPPLDTTAMRQLLPVAAAISLVGFMESISVAKAFARHNRYQLDANQELVGLGLANLAASVLRGYPVTGGFSRTAVNAQAGARTGLASIITAAAIALTLMFLTPLFYYLPKAVLAAIIMVAVFGLVDTKEIRHLYRVKRADLALLLLTFGATLVLGIEGGILTGVVGSLLAVIYRITRPHCVVLGRIPGTHAYRSVERYPQAETFAGVLALRMDAQFYFGNVTFLKEALSRRLAEASRPTYAVVLNAATINHLDSSADAALHEIVADLRERGIEMYFANVRGPVLDVLRRSGFIERVGKNHFTLSVTRAVTKARAYVARVELAESDAGATAEPAESSTEQHAPLPDSAKWQQAL